MRSTRVAPLLGRSRMLTTRTLRSATTSFAPSRWQLFPAGAGAGLASTAHGSSVAVAIEATP